MIAIRSLDDAAPSPGSVVTWHPSAAALAEAEQAPISDVPASYQQAQHLRNFCGYAARGLDMARLVTATCELPGRCDIRAMTYVINSHLRRHDTYRSWFECKDAEHIVRHTIRNPANIEFVPTKHGEMTSAEWRNHILATPSPLCWDCFRVTLIQRADQFTMCLSIDHLHIDPVFVSVIFVEIFMMYAALVADKAPPPLPAPSSYHDYCVRQHRYTSGLTLESAQVRAWIQFAENNGGSYPKFPLPLGDPSVPCGGDVITVPLLSEQQADRFESACLAAGARFSGGVFACAALAEHELTGAETYHGVTPTDTRSTPAELVTQGWFTGLVPITVPVAGMSFADTARAAQASFDSGMDLAKIPFDRVLELAPWLRSPHAGFLMLSFLDAGLPPLSALVNAHLGLNTSASAYFDGRTPTQVSIWVNRRKDQTFVTAVLPKNPIAYDSVMRYIATMKSMYIRVADATGRSTSAPRLSHNSVPTRV